MENLFLHNITPPEKLTQPVMWFIFKGDEILLGNAMTRLPILQSTEIASLNLKLRYQNYLGLYANTHCFVAEAIEDGPLPQDIGFQHLRNLYLVLQHETLFQLASRAKQILYWDKSTQFCGTCGQKTAHSTKERAKTCSGCEALMFPHVAPVVLVCITRGQEILLARSPHFPPRIYSILAGFVEPGESIEQTAIREVAEEVAIQIKDLKYFGSQPWPFPSNLMLGFTATYAGGEIKKDEIEIEDAQWFHKNHLPDLPQSYSLSRQLIDAFCEQS